MNTFLWNLGLAGVWAAATGSLTVGNLIAGFVLGHLVLAFVRPAADTPRYLAKVRQLVAFSAFFVYEVLRANLQVAHDVMTPAQHSRPGVLAIPLDAETDEEIALLAGLITLTPGTLALDVSEDRKTLYIHAMFIDDPETSRRELKQGMERRLLEVLR